MRPFARRFRGAALVALTAATLLVSAVLGVTLHLNTPPARRVLERLARTQLNAELKGDFELGSVRRASLAGFEISTASVKDLQGVEVLYVEDLNVKWSTSRFLAGLMQSDLEIRIRQCSARYLRITLREDKQSATPSLKLALSPAEPASASTDASVRVDIESVQIKKTEIEGGLFDAKNVRVRMAAIEGALHVTPAGLSVRVDPFRVSLSGLLPVAVTGDVSAQLETAGVSRASFDGSVGAVRLSANGSLDAKGEHPFRATAAVWNATPHAVSQIWKPWPIRSPAELHLTIRGTPVAAKLNGVVSLGGARGWIDGEFAANRELELALKLDVAGLQLKSFMARPPKGRVSLSAQLKAWYRANRWMMDINGTAAATELDEIPVPAVDFQASIDSPRISGHLKLHEPGMPTHVDFKTRGNALAFTAKVRPFKLQNATRLAESISLRGQAEARLEGELTSDKIHLAASVAAREVHVGNVLSLPDSKARLTVSGPLDPARLRLAGELTAFRLNVSNYGFSELRAVAQGALLTPDVELETRGPFNTQLFVGARVPLATPSRLNTLRAAVGARGQRITAKATRLDVNAGTLALRDFVIAGAGKPISGTLLVAPGRIRAKIHSEGIDLRALARIAGVSEPVTGQLGVAADFRIDRGTPSGGARLRLDSDQLGALGRVVGIVEMRAEE